MVHPRAFGKFLFKKYKATVIDDIWPELIFFTGVAVSELHFWALWTNFLIHISGLLRK